MDNDIYRVLHQKLIHHPTRREREREAMFQDQGQLLRRETQRREDQNKKTDSSLFHFRKWSNVGSKMRITSSMAEIL